MGADNPSAVIAPGLVPRQTWGAVLYPEISTGGTAELRVCRKVAICSQLIGNQIHPIAPCVPIQVAAAQADLTVKSATVYVDGFALLAETDYGLLQRRGEDINVYPAALLRLVPVKSATAYISRSRLGEMQRTSPDSAVPLESTAGDLSVPW